MIALAIETLAQAIESAGLRFADAALDGSSVAKRCVIGVVDPKIVRENQLTVGIDYRYPLGIPQDRPQVGGARKIQVLNAATGQVAVIPPSQYVTRAVAVHVYIRETREPRLRVVDDVNTTYWRCEKQLSKKLGLTRTDYEVGVGTGLFFRTQYDGSQFVDGDFLGLHAVLTWRMTYPILNDVSDGIIGYRARRIRLVHLPHVANVPTIISQLPLVVPRDTKIYTLEA
jgi:hypothetical protein